MSTTFDDLSFGQRGRVVIRLIRLMEPSKAALQVDFASALRRDLAIQRLRAYVAGVQSAEVGREWLEVDESASLSAAETAQYWAEHGEDDHLQEASV